jgi:hypothetical protein
VTVTASLIAVSNFDQLPHRMLPIPNHVRRHTLGNSYNLSVHYEHAVIAAFRKLFYYDPVSVFGRRFPGSAKLIRIAESS